ncbi:MAG TPA: protein-glutamate O-methyltransferase CheR [Bacteroidia bacterium]|nr:protein-glutamate O-methyltransferase CheR [Bacteroidia bacterium]
MLLDSEIEEVAELIYSTHNFDFRNYARSSFSRRLYRFMSIMKFSSKADLIEYISTAKNFNSFVEEITVNTTEMFRDPSFWVAIKQNVLPLLNVHQNIKIWHAACSSGEEVISMQIILRELEIENKVITYATDIDSAILEKARTATYSEKSLISNQANYIAAGGEYDLTRYIKLKTNNSYTFKEELLENVIFKKFDLVQDIKYTKFDLILCRNVLIYFDFDLQEKVINKFISSLFSQGFIAIGQNETILNSSNLSNLNLFDSVEKIYRSNR